MSNNSAVQSNRKSLLNNTRSRKRDNAEHNAISPLIKVSEVELIYKSKIKTSERFTISSSRDCIQLFRQFWDENKIELQEEFKVMLLNNALKVLGICTVSSGGLTATVADPKLIFSIAIKSMAKSIIVAHNHPSGNLNPSDTDRIFTEKLKNGAELLDINLLDSIIITKDEYFSFADSGIL